MEAIHIRSVKPGDEAIREELLYIGLWDAPDEPRRPRSVLEHPKIRAYLDDWGREGDVCVMAEIAGDPVGAASCRVKKCVTQEYADLPELSIAVLPEYQEKGIGKRLMKRLIEKVRPYHPGMRLGVHPKNVRARGLYEKLGFREYAHPAGQYPQMVLLFDER